MWIISLKSTEWSTFGRKGTVAECEVNMTEETQVQEVAQEAQENPSQPVIEAEAKQSEAPKEAPKSDVEHNWRQAQEVLRLQKQRIEELEAKMSQMEKPPEPEKDEFADLDPEEYLTVNQARKMAEKLAEKKAEVAAKKIVQEYAQQQNLQNSESHCRSKYEDYDYVIENYALPLLKNDPALAYKVQTSKNPAETAYKLGKLSDSYEEGSMKQQTSPKAEKILKNTSRPVSGNSVGNPLKTQADQFTKYKPSEIWEMSQKFARGA